MGWIRHHAILITSWDKDKIEADRDLALDLRMAATEIIESPINGYMSFFIAPDGSKEGWEDSDDGDEAREKFIAGCCCADVVEVEYGGDDPYSITARACGDGIDEEDD
jgi:hypothetical protein